VVAGYAASALAVVGLVVYAINSMRSSTVTAVSTEESTHAPSAMSAKAQQPKSVDSTQKSQQMNTIMIADLIQMVKEVSFPSPPSLCLVILSPILFSLPSHYSQEDEQLQKTMASDHFRV
jgi:hypothetical protein